MPRAAAVRSSWPRFSASATAGSTSRRRQACSWAWAGCPGTTAAAMRPRWKGKPARASSSGRVATSSSVPSGSSGLTFSAWLVSASTATTRTRPARPQASRSSTRIRPSATKHGP